MFAVLYELLRKDVKKMINGLGEREPGNIHPLLVQQIEKYLIEMVLEETDNNFVHTSRILGISRSTLYRKIDLLGIEVRPPLKY